MAGKVADLPYDQYQERIRAMATQPLPAEFARAPAHAYRRRAGGSFAPARRPGCTVLAEPYPITSPARRVLALLQRHLRDQCPDFAAVPGDTLHMTVADLKSGEAYDAMTASQRTAYCARAATILSGHHFPGDAAGAIAGVSAFPFAVIAVVSLSPAAYQALMKARDAIRTGLGLSPQWPFTGHVTLGYIESAQRQQAEGAVLSARQVFAQAASGRTVTFRLSAASVYTFGHMSRFDRWP